MTILSLTTDFGLLNSFVGVMKGVIFGIAPDARIVDITHDIPAQDVRAGSLTLWRAASYFPEDSVHVAVVDPGVGTDRRPIGARLGHQLFIAPDNGLLTAVIEAAEAREEVVEFFHLDRPDYWLPKVSRTFHGRDIFAPCGAHLSTGVPLDRLGTRIDDPVRLDLRHPEKTAQGWQAHITLIDVFGNLSTDLPAEVLPPGEEIRIRIHGREIKGLVESYGHARLGGLIALVDSEDYIEIAQVSGSAARTLGAQVDDLVEVYFKGGGI